jgi:hypothetical protein
MGGGPTVRYEQPRIERDNTFAEYLKYQQERERLSEEKAATAAAEEKRKEEARKASGASAYSGLRSGVESQLRQGLLSYKDATSQLRDFAAKYDMTPPEEDVNKLTQVYTQELRPGRLQSGIGAAYEELLGRQATAEEKQTALERFNQGYYSNVQDLKDSLLKKPEYQEKFNTSYLANYYDTMFGKQTVGADGKKTGKRAFTFDQNLLPSVGSQDLAKRTGVATPSFKDQFIGTPSEIEEQVQNVRDTRQYLFSAGLTNLQGEIDKETQKLKNEGAKDVQKIQEQGGLYRALVGSFSFS